MGVTHTPGPWIVDREQNDLVWRNSLAIRATGGGTVAHTTRGRETGKDGDTRAYSNARLIAAAPDLLAALRECTDRFEKCCIFGGTDADIAAIAVQSYRELLAKVESVGASTV